MNESTPPRFVTCPTCGRPVAWITSSRFRPFCSQRCKLIDLGDWAAERHVIPDEKDGFILGDDHTPPVPPGE
jgi:endogenous inhibitor of DNA gyrase (YacG/DUF329 family)